jgi:hypothetical protein
MSGRFTEGFLSYLVVEAGRAVIFYDVHRQTNSANENDVLQKCHEGAHDEGDEEV